MSVCARVCVYVYICLCRPVPREAICHIIPCALKSLSVHNNIILHKISSIVDSVSFAIQHNILLWGLKIAKYILVQQTYT